MYFVERIRRGRGGAKKITNHNKIRYVFSTSGF